MQVDTATLQAQMLDIPTSDGVIIRAQVLGAADAATRLVISHGNGLAAGGYASFWRQLAFDYQLVLLDFRGHGQSDSGSLENHSWDQFQLDFDLVMRAIPEALGERKTFGAFHSLSAVTSLLHAKRYGPVCDGLVLFDPPIIPQEGHPLRSAHIDEMMGLASRVGKRRSQFDEWQELAAQFRRSSMFARCLPEACDEMARALLRPVEQGDEGSWRLSCDPQYEAKIFATNDDTSLWSWLGDIDFPVKFLCADPAVPGVQPSAPIGRQMAAEFGLDYVCVPETTHFLQMERPDLCAELTRDFCR